MRALDVDDLAGWLAEGCKPEARWRIGTEHEKIGFLADSLRPLPYDGERSVRRILELMAGITGWEIVREDGLPIALADPHSPASVTLEPGGQLELSGAPLASLFDTCRETTDHLELLSEISRRLRTGFLSLGFQPKWRRDEIPWMPKARYRIMRRIMPATGTRGLDMMLRSATVQANLDFSSEADMAAKMRIGLCLQPVVTALFAASPFEDGRPSGFLSTRAACWQDTDPARTGIPACAFRDDFGFRAYAEWALDVPMYFVVRNGRWINCAGASFRDFLAGRLPQLPGERPTLADWELHLSTLFPEVRLKRYLEMRGADAGPWNWICALPALWKGLLYDAETRAEALAWVRDWTHAEVVGMHARVPREGLATPFRDTTVGMLARRMLDLARRGLERLGVRDKRGRSEAVFLAPLEAALASGRTQAEAWLASFHGEWHGDIDRIFAEAIHP